MQDKPKPSKIPQLYKESTLKNILGILYDLRCVPQFKGLGRSGTDGEIGAFVTSLPRPPKVGKKWPKTYKMLLFYILLGSRYKLLLLGPVVRVPGRRA